MVPHHRCFISSTSTTDSTATSSTSAPPPASSSRVPVPDMDTRDDVRKQGTETPVMPPDKDSTELPSHQHHRHHRHSTDSDRHARAASESPESTSSASMHHLPISSKEGPNASQEVSALARPPSPAPADVPSDTRVVAAGSETVAMAAVDVSASAIAESSTSTTATNSPRLFADTPAPSSRTSLDGSRPASRPRSRPATPNARATRSNRSSPPTLNRSSSDQNMSHRADGDLLTSSAAASTSTNPARYVDPDTHWLSEDEGATQHRHRRPRRRHRSSSFGAGGHSMSDEGQNKDDEGTVIARRSQARATHAIHHRPAAVSAAMLKADSNQSEETPIQAVTPVLLHRLTCQACGYLLRDPTTLSCGHTVCLSCDGTPHDTDVTIDSVPISRLHGLPATESLFARNPDHPIDAGQLPTVSTVASGMVRTESSGTISSIGKRSRIPCSYPNCSKKDRAVLTEHRVDFILQKVLSVIRRDIPDVDTAVAKAKEAVDEFIASEESTDTTLPPLVRRASGSSSCESETAVGDDAKRTHHRKSGSQSAKRMRRRAFPPGSKEEPVPRPIDFLDLTAVPKTFLSDLQSELECQVCVQLFLDPLTAPCGHTFCQKCLQRALDHSDKCPLCRSDFPSFSYISTTPINQTTQAILLSAFGKLSAERREIAEAESRSAQLDTPVFVCTLAWPSLPTYIHVFEPRYRLMIRRALETDRQFGMVLPDRSNGGVHEYGTMLYINSCNLTEDGRSILETVGTYRFRVLEKGTFDGYTVARIERIDDISPEQEAELEHAALVRNAAAGPTAQKEMSTAELMQLCLGFVETLRTGSAPWVLQRLNNTIGPMPTNPADFSFWMAEVMPVDDHLKASLLQITSPRERLRLIVFWIEQFRSSWWFSRGCSLM